MVSSNIQQTHRDTDIMANGVHHDSTLSHILMIPDPSQPHIFPMLDLARQIVSHEDILVTLVSFQSLVDPINEKNLQQFGKDGKCRQAIRLIGVSNDRPGFDPPGHLYPSELQVNVMRHNFRLAYNLEPFFDTLLHADKNEAGWPRPTCIVTDLMNWWSTEIASKLNVPKYTLNVFNPLLLVAWLSFYAQDPGNEGHKKKGSVAIPMEGKPDVVVDIAERHPGSYPRLPLLYLNGFSDLFFQRWSSGIQESDGLLMNSCLGLESPILEFLNPIMPKKIPIFGVGPLGVGPESFSNGFSVEGVENSDDVKIMRWLDEQPAASVLYVGFGTTGMLALSKQHVFNMAQGLEASGQRFVWALRAPPDLDDCAKGFPPGFEERVKGRALLVRGWAPQKRILAHPSTGAFLSSCGWNSALESLFYGVPIIGWPSYADQPAVCVSVGRSDSAASQRTCNGRARSNQLGN